MSNYFTSASKPLGPNSPNTRSSVDDRHSPSPFSSSVDTNIGPSTDELMDHTLWPSLSVNDINAESIDNCEMSDSEEELFQAELQNHKQAIRDGSMDKAIQSFILLQSKGSQSETFLEYLVEITENVGPNRDSDLSRFFASLPGLIQQTIVESASAYLEEVDALKSFLVLYDYILAYPRHAYKYLIRTINQLVVYIQSIEIMDPVECEDYERILVTDLLKKLCKQRIRLAGRDRLSFVRSTDSKHFIVVAYNVFEHYLLIGLRYHVRHHQWDELNKFAGSMLECCGYSGLGRPGLWTHVDLFQAMKEQRANVRLDADGWMDDTLDRRQRPGGLHVLAAFMCEFMIVSAQFIQFGYDYYKAICISRGAQKDNACLIPICSMEKRKSPCPNPDDGGFRLADDIDATMEERPQRSINTKATDEDEGVITDTSSTESSPSTEAKRQPRKRKRQDDGAAETPDRGEGLDSFCVKGVDDSLRILSSAGDCLRHLVSMWHWGTRHAPKTNWENVFGGWEQELSRIIENCRLPFDIYNAVLLVRSDLALSMPAIPGNLAKALRLSQKICDRIEIQRRIQRASVVKVAEYNIPFMFAFRVLYNISVIYLVNRDIQQSIMEIAIILSVFPIPNDLNEADFLVDEADCRTIATVFNGRDFGLMRVTQRGLIARCMKHLIISLDSKECGPAQYKGSMSSIESSRSWDDRVGSMLVLMQYGWTYWTSRTCYWRKCLQQIQDKRMFKNRDFLEFIYTPEILRTILTLQTSDQVTFDIIAPESAYRLAHTIFGGLRSAPLSSQTARATKARSSSQIARHSEDFATSPGEMVIDSSASSCDEEGSVPTTSSRPSRGAFTTAASCSVASTAAPPNYQPVRIMSPSWYATSVQKISHAGWMSPSYYSSRSTTLAAAAAAEAAARLAGSGVCISSSSSNSTSIYTSTSISTSTRSSPSRDTANVSYNVASSFPQRSGSVLPKQVTTHHLTNYLHRYSGNKCSQSMMRDNLQKFLRSVVLKTNKMD